MFNKFWFKVHFILGLIFGFILLIVGVTGGVMSFEKEILKAMNPKSYTVESFNTAVPPMDEIIDNFKKNIPDAKINAITISSDKTSSMIINIASKDPNQKRGISYFINPYTGEILPQLVGQSFFDTVENIHRRLLLGDIGKQIVGLSSVILLVLLFSGLYLYFPRLKRTFLASFTFSFNSKGRYFLHSIHSSIGLWVLPFYILAVLTGLYWSYDLYRQGIHAISGVPMAVKQIPTTAGQQDSKINTQKEEKIENQSRINKEQKKDNRPKEISYGDLNKAVNMFEIFLQKEYVNAMIRIPQDGSVYTISYMNTHAEHSRARNQMQIDINSWELLKHDEYDNKPLNQKLIGSMLPLHSGEYFGIIGQSIMFIASLLMPLFAVTGLMLYLNRTFKKKKDKSHQ